MNPDFYAINTMIDTSLAFERKAKEEKVKMFLGIFAFFIVLVFMIGSIFILKLQSSYSIVAFCFIEVIGLIFSFIINKYIKSCKTFLSIYRKALYELFPAIFEYECYIKWDNDFEKNLIKQRLLLVNPNV